MCEVETLRDFISERLSAAATEIFGAFKQTVVKYEEEIDRQRRMLDIILKPELKLHRVDLPQQHWNDKKEDVLSDQQRNSTLNPSALTAVQFKEETESEHTPLIITLNHEIKLHRIELPQQHQCKEEVVQVKEQLSIEDQGQAELPQVKEEQEKPESPEIIEEDEAACSSQDGQEPEQSQDADSSALNYEKLCKICGGSFESWSQLIIHQRSHVQEGLCYCNTCGKTFNDSTQLTLHMVDHAGKPFSCEICGKSYTKRCHMIGHKRVHTNERPYSCKQCGKSFSLLPTLVRHEKIHTGEKPNVCTTCGRGFVQKNDLLRHMRVHTGSKPFSCKTCSRGFSEYNDLILHLKVHTGGKPYKCETCGASFTSSFYLKRHTLSHTGEKGFTENGDVVRHSRVHTREKKRKSLVCKTCGKTFAKNSDLTRHMSAHDAEKPFTCKICEESFTQHDDFISHEESCHKSITSVPQT